MRPTLNPETPKPLKGLGVLEGPMGSGRYQSLAKLWDTPLYSLRSHRASPVGVHPNLRCRAAVFRLVFVSSYRLKTAVQIEPDS